MDKKHTPFGLWQSPITTAMVGERKRLQDVQWNNDGRSLVWLDQRAGKGVLVCWRGEEGVNDLTAEYAVRGGIGYGGGEFYVLNSDIVFVLNGQRLMKCGLNGDLPYAIMPSMDNIASPVVSPDGRWVAFVSSDGEMDLLGLADATGSQWPVKLEQGADFYMQPVWHPGGKWLAWVEWDHPNMPWDGTRLMVCGLKGSRPQIGSKVCIAGDDQKSVSQPQFSPEGRWLSFIEANGDWDDLVLIDMKTRERRVVIKGERFMLTPPAWVQGIRSYGWSSSAEKIFQIRSYWGVETLWETDLNSGVSQQIQVEPYSSIRQLSVSAGEDKLAFIASGPQMPEGIVIWQAGIMNRVSDRDVGLISPDYLPVPQHLSWRSKDGHTVYGYYYPPTNPTFRSKGLPPAIISIHGGPTGMSNVCFNMKIAYFTSRGYAWMEVNYRGSAGYGHTYRKALEGQWGVLDVEDCVDAAQALVDQGLADGDQLVVHGSSAGGYTVLNTLCLYPDRFKAGLCLYGISNLFTALEDTLKFETHYFDRLIGVLPQAKQIFHARSAVFHADQIRSPLAIFQGGADKVVFPNQSGEIVSALRKNNVPYLYTLYPDEGHGFRKPETIDDVLTKIEEFLKQYVLSAARI